MKTYITRRGVLFLLLALTLLVSGCGTAQHTPGITQSHNTPTPPPTPTPTPSPTPTPTPTVADPARLSIPSIGVNAPVEPVGLAPDGSLATPTQQIWTDVGWFHLGPRPGERGSAVIDGHLDDHSSAPAVFWNLKNLQSGDEVQVTDSTGRVLHFRVTRVATYPPDQAPLQEIFGATDGSYLNLITCAGDWIPSKQQLSLRVVVYTTLM